YRHWLVIHSVQYQLPFSSAQESGVSTAWLLQFHIAAQPLLTVPRSSPSRCSSIYTTTKHSCRSWKCCMYYMRKRNCLNLSFHRRISDGYMQHGKSLVSVLYRKKDTCLETLPILDRDPYNLSFSLNYIHFVYIVKVK